MKSERSDSHGWTSLENYIHVHESYMRRLMDDGFVIGHDLDTATIPAELTLRGRIHCQHGLFLAVRKNYAVAIRNGRRWIKTEGCKDHAGLEGREARSIFRYDNAHPYPGHPDNYHRHRFDPATWQEIDPPTWIGRANWPHLSDAIEELATWWDETGRFLGAEE